MRTEISRRAFLATTTATLGAVASSPGSLPAPPQVSVPPERPLAPQRLLGAPRRPYGDRSPYDKSVRYF